jgi:hypothetical protein
MREVVNKTIGQQKEIASYHIVKHSQDMATVIRQAVAVHASHLSQFALVAIAFQFAVINKSSRVSSVANEHSMRYLLNAIRGYTRQSDLVWLKDTTCYFLLAGANLEGGNVVQHRLWSAVEKSIQIMQEEGMTLPCTTAIGHSAYPEPSTTIEQCLDDALIQCEMQQKEVIQEPTLPEADLSMMARQFGVPYLPFLPRTLPNKIKELIKPELAQELHCFPLGCAHNTLTVAMSNPQDNQILSRLRQETGMRIFPVLIHPDELQNALEHITR